MVLDSPLAHCRIILHCWLAAAALHALTRPCRVENLAQAIPSLSGNAAPGLLALLQGSGMLSEWNDSGSSAEDETPALWTWEFHDLLFHARSRQGRHDHPVGGTYRFAGRIDPPPVLHPPRQGETIALDRPDLDRLEREDPPFAAVSRGAAVDPHLRREADLRPPAWRIPLPRRPGGRLPRFHRRYQGGTDRDDLCASPLFPGRGASTSSSCTSRSMPARISRPAFILTIPATID